MFLNVDKTDYHISYQTSFKRKQPNPKVSKHIPTMPSGILCALAPKLTTGLHLTYPNLE